jgi:hypothetical protein
MPPTKRVDWNEIDHVDDSLKYDKRFDWLRGAVLIPV